MPKLNARQQELLQRYTEMLTFAIQWARDNQKSQDIYEVEIPKEDFLVYYEIQRGVGEYAGKRYFSQFAKFGAFKMVNDHEFNVVYEKARKLARIYGIGIPEPKKEEEKPKRGDIAHE